MKNFAYFFPFGLLLFTLIFSSCENENDINKDESFPSDSLYFSCEVDGKFIEVKSPISQIYNKGNFIYKFDNFKSGERDSVLIGLYYTFDSENYNITMRFIQPSSRDTSDRYFPFLTDVEKIKLLEQEEYQFQYLYQEYLDDEKLINKLSGVSIDIIDYNTNKRLVSYLHKDINDEQFFKRVRAYDNFNTIETERIDDDFFIQSEFNCYLYPSRYYEHSEEIQLIQLTNGKFRAILNGPIN